MSRSSGTMTAKFRRVRAKRTLKLKGKPAKEKRERGREG